jgi:hypothetical protein
MHFHTIFLNITTKYVLCNNFNTPLTYSTSVSINPNMRELHYYNRSLYLRVVTHYSNGQTVRGYYHVATIDPQYQRVGFDPLLL